MGGRGKEEELALRAQGGVAFCTKLGRGRSLDGTEKGFFFQVRIGGLGENRWNEKWRM